jgi:hypothetical protein
VKKLLCSFGLTLVQYHVRAAVSIGDGPLSMCVTVSVGSEFFPFYMYIILITVTMIIRRSLTG